MAPSRRREPDAGGQGGLKRKLARLNREFSFLSRAIVVALFRQRGVIITVSCKQFDEALPVWPTAASVVAVGLVCACSSLGSAIAQLLAALLLSFFLNGFGRTIALGKAAALPFGCKLSLSTLRTGRAISFIERWSWWHQLSLNAHALFLHAAGFGLGRLSGAVAGSYHAMPVLSLLSCAFIQWSVFVTARTARVRAVRTLLAECSPEVFNGAKSVVVDSATPLLGMFSRGRLLPSHAKQSIVHGLEEVHLRGIEAVLVAIFEEPYDTRASLERLRRALLKELDRDLCRLLRDACAETLGTNNWPARLDFDEDDLAKLHKVFQARAGKVSAALDAAGFPLGDDAPALTPESTESFHQDVVTPSAESQAESQTDAAGGGAPGGASDAGAPTHRNIVSVGFADAHVDVSLQVLCGFNSEMVSAAFERCVESVTMSEAAKALVRRDKEPLCHEMVVRLVQRAGLAQLSKEKSHISLDGLCHAAARRLAAAAVTAVKAVLPEWTSGNSARTLSVRPHEVCVRLPRQARAEGKLTRDRVVEKLLELAKSFGACVGATLTVSTTDVTWAADARQPDTRLFLTRRQFKLPAGTPDRFTWTCAAASGTTAVSKLRVETMRPLAKALQARSGASGASKENDKSSESIAAAGTTKKKKQKP
jgi:hypothetical protein